MQPCALQSLCLMRGKLCSVYFGDGKSYENRPARFIGIVDRFKIFRNWIMFKMNTERYVKNWFNKNTGCVTGDLSSRQLREECL